LLAAVAVGYLLATSYLMLRDDILNAAIARQARMQYAYEDRISALRSQVDRITSYRLLDQQIMEIESRGAVYPAIGSGQAKRSALPRSSKEAANSGLAPRKLDRLDPARVPVPEIGEELGRRRSERCSSLQQPVEAG
jgi:hypothetical protein